MITCDDIAQKISAYYDKELSEDEMALVSKHLESCEGCQATYHEFSDLSAFLAREITTIEAPASLERLVTMSIAERLQSHYGFRITWGSLLTTMAMLVCIVCMVVSPIGRIAWSMSRILWSGLKTGSEFLGQNLSGGISATTIVLPLICFAFAIACCLFLIRIYRRLNAA
ncbi:anti-sigma factor family protein [Alicyclobacillus dauci]|uniref:Anti-sigma-W factor RsiW n=1 Tax=Alicyclobacillus dauci TaxID=1475485 RepID=A0ABY6Z634_9BACL|nr:zf-HC2 domain-containing protein [Alicyclobacillus dauci]WAH38363.1 anti-sigma factor [Alicyclobacillus dauci]